MATEFKEQSLNVAVLLPCYNEEKAIGITIDDFKKHLPTAKLYVFDNNSTDRTAEVATSHGASVVRSPRQGKGNVVKHMFQSIEADYYVMADGDSTYPASEAHLLIDQLRAKHHSMVVGTRVVHNRKVEFRRFHRFGNQLITFLIAKLFGISVTDVLSGYRVFTRDFVKNIPLRSSGFEIETELTLQAAAKGFSIGEVDINYGTRPEGSFSKLSTFSDGLIIIKAIFTILKTYRPLMFFGGISLTCFVLGILSGLPAIFDYIEYRYVYHVPLAILASLFMILSFMSFGIGIILDTLHQYHQETFSLLKNKKD